MPLQPRPMHDRRRDLFDRACRRVEYRDALALHELLGFANFVAATLERGILAVRSPRLPDLLQPLGIDRQTEEAIAVGQDRRRQLAVDEIIRRKRKISGEN